MWVINVQDYNGLIKRREDISEHGVPPKQAFHFPNYLPNPNPRGDPFGQPQP